MKKCAKCKTELSEKVQRCPKCGHTYFIMWKERQIPCPNCGESNPARRGSCFNCGNKLN